MALAAALALHRVEAHLFELSGLRTGSVRDQLVRAQLLVRELYAERLIGSDRPLIVAGAGGAGIAAALTALPLGVDVDVLEQHKNPFQTQLAVTTRWLDPTEFDWPHAHWTQGDISWGGVPHALPYLAGSASTLAATWSAVLLLVLLGPAAPALPAGFGRLRIFYGVDARTFTFRSVPSGVTVTPPRGSQLSYGAAISCIGFSGEHTSIRSTAGSEFVGPKFWSVDNLARLRAGLPAGSATTRVLVSGGGDGAQQDFLRVLTGQFGKALFHALGLHAMPMSVEVAVLAEDYGRRSHGWSPKGVKPARDYSSWHDAYEQLAGAIWASWQSSGTLSQKAGVLFPDIRATWLVGAESPGYCYGLNRLLCLLVAKLHAMQWGRPETGGRTGSFVLTGDEVVLYDAKLRSVTAVNGHVCSDRCNGLEHEIHVSGGSAFASAGPHRLGTFDVLVIRHGVAPKPLFAGGAPIPEQLVPMQVPR